MTPTLHNSQVHCSGFTQSRIRSSLMSVSLPAEAGGENYERIVLLLAFIS